MDNDVIHNGFAAAAIMLLLAGASEARSGVLARHEAGSPASRAAAWLAGEDPGLDAVRAGVKRRGALASS